MMMMMMVHHAPPSPSARVVYHFSPVLPAWPCLSSAWCFHHHHLLQCLDGPQWTLLDLFLYAALGPGHYHWIMLYLWCPELFPIFFLDFLKLNILYFLFCGTNMLRMFCVRAVSGLLGFRTVARPRSLHFFPGITVAQVGSNSCMKIPRLLLYMLKTFYNKLLSISLHVMSYIIVYVTNKERFDLVHVCVPDWGRGSQTLGAEGTVRRRWWQTSVCPQNTEGKPTVLPYENTLMFEQKVIYNSGPQLFWCHRLTLLPCANKISVNVCWGWGFNLAMMSCQQEQPFKNGSSFR